MRSYASENVFSVGDIVGYLGDAAKHRGRRRRILSCRKSCVAPVTVKRWCSFRVITTKHCVTISISRSVTSRACGEYVHTLADGRRFLLLHGDEFDAGCSITTGSPRRRGLRCTRQTEHGAVVQCAAVSGAGATGRWRGMPSDACSCNSSSISGIPALRAAHQRGWTESSAGISTSP